MPGIAQQATTNSTTKLVLTWATVLVPAAWGIYNTAMRALQLLR